jgi:hypothetical protein
VTESDNRLPRWKPWTPNAREFSEHSRAVARAAVVLGGLVLILFFANRQWLRENVLQNSPAYDALVYQNQSYDDYLLIRHGGFSAVLEKYTDGRWHVPPLYMLSGTLTYIFLGTDPANFYIMPAVWLYLMLLSTFGITHYYTGKVLWGGVASVSLLVTPSLVNFGLRVSQIDFSAGCAFTAATYLFILSEGLKRPRWAALYGCAGCIAILMKSSLTPYFAAHALLFVMGMVLEPLHRRRRFLGAVIVVSVLLLLTGWFYWSNWRQIVAYYAEWGTTLSHISEERFGLDSWWKHLLFYGGLLYGFHLRASSFWPFCYAAVASLSLFAWVSWQTRTASGDRRSLTGIIVVMLWLIIPYAILTAYPSKAPTVDFPFLAAWFVVPVLMLASVCRGRWVPVAALVVFGPHVLYGAKITSDYLVMQSPTRDWRESEILADILRDAESRGLDRMAVSNTFIDRYLTSENLRFFVLSGEHAKWRSRFAVTPIGYYTRSEDFLKAVKQADYVLTRWGATLPHHPDNELTEAVNDALSAAAEFSILDRYRLPDSSELVVMRHDARQWLRHAGVQDDGWITAPFRLELAGPARDTTIRLVGRMPLPAGSEYPAVFILRTTDGSEIGRAHVVDQSQVSLEIAVPADVMTQAPGPTTLWLESPNAFIPHDLGISADDRLLLLLPERIDLVERVTGASR